MNKRLRFTVFAAIALWAVFAFGSARISAQTVYFACTWDTSSIFKDKAGKEKFERRFYVSPIISLAHKEFQRIDSDGNRFEGVCGDYLEKTVMKAAADRGERLDPGGQLRVHRGVELSGNDIGSKEMYKFATRENIQKLIDADTKEMIDANRFIMKFNWDPTGKAEADDYAAEQKRVIPTVQPKPPGNP